MRKLIARLADIGGLSHHGDRYRYASDPLRGPMHAANAPDRWVRTTCGYCSVGCGMLVGVTGTSPNGAGTQAVAVTGDPNHPVNLGRLCPKGLSEHRMLDVEGRLLHPQVDGRNTSWDTALDAMLDRFQTLIDRYGPESVAVISTGQLVTEEFYALGKLVRLGLGLTHYDGNTTLCMASAVSGYKMTLGSDGPPGAYEDLEHTDCLLLIGANIADNHPLLAPRVLGNRAATTIVVDPRITKTSMLADLHLPLLPRTDIALLNGIIKLVIDEGLVDQTYIEDHTEGFAELAERVQPYTLDRVSRQCGLQPEDIERAARAFGTAERAVAAWTMGVNHSVQGSETSRSSPPSA